MIRNIAWVFFLFIAQVVMSFAANPKGIDVAISSQNGSITINGTTINSSSDVNALQGTLGKHNRVSIETGYKNYFYDELGILIIENLQTEKIEGVAFQYNPRDSEFATKKGFKGKLMIDSSKIGRTKSATAIKKGLQVNIIEDQPTKISAANTKLRIDFLFNKIRQLELIYATFKPEE